MCGKYDETVNHSVSECLQLAKTEYVHSNGRVKVLELRFDKEGLRSLLKR